MNDHITNLKLESKKDSLQAMNYGIKIGKRALNLTVKIIWVKTMSSSHDF